MKHLEYVIKKAAGFFGYLSGWLVPLMMILVAVEVFMRYVLHNPPMLADEFSALRDDTAERKNTIRESVVELLSAPSLVRRVVSGVVLTFVLLAAAGWIALSSLITVVAGVAAWLIRTRAQAVSRRLTLLSGSWRPVM